MVVWAWQMPCQQRLAFKIARDHIARQSARPGSGWKFWLCPHEIPHVPRHYLLLSLLPTDPEKEEMMRQLNLQYGGCVYVTRKLRKHEKEAKERAEAAEAAAAAAARASQSGMLLLLLVGRGPGGGGLHPYSAIC